MEPSKMLQTYLQALGVTEVSNDFASLCTLVSRHVATFSFSSVTCQLGEALPIDFPSLFARIVQARRGGYCFEQNGLFFELLQLLGFSPQLSLGRVIYNKDIHPGLTHRITLIEANAQRYVVDVGFGPLGPRIPVLLSETESIDGDKRFRVATQNNGEHHLQVFKDGAFFTLYRFELARYGQADCELGHFYSHQHPKAAFVNHLVVSRLMAEETRSLRNLEYQVIKGPEIHAQSIERAKQLKDILVTELDIQVTDAEAEQLFAKHR